MYITAAKTTVFPSGPGLPHKNVRGYSIIFRAQFLVSLNNPIWYGPWPYGRWVYNYLCNQCLSPLTL